jgi:hypothetical protein
MGAYPTSPRSAFLLWCAGHVEPFTNNAAAIGITPAMATLFSDAVDAATNKTAEQQAARQALSVASEEVADAFGELRSVTSDIVRTVKAFAENSSKPLTVYSLAQIDPPAPPSPVPAPGTPDNFKVSLLQTGTLEISWKCQNPPGSQGTVYIIERRLNAAGSYAFRAAVGEKKFVDNSVPFGTDQIDYRITAQRSDATGNPAVWTVRFGSGGGTFTVEQVQGGEAPKLAA